MEEHDPEQPAEWAVGPEDEYDALNDETFGDTTGGGMHECMASLYCFLYLYYVSNYSFVTRAVKKVSTRQRNVQCTQIMHEAKAIMP